MLGDEVADLLLAGLRAYGVAATAYVRPIGPRQRFVSIDADPDGVDLEVSETATTVRVLWSGGTVDEASLGDALNLLAVEAGVLPRGHRPR